MRSNEAVENPGGEYTRRLQSIKQRQALYTQRHKWLGTAKLAIVLTLPVLVWAIKARGLTMYSLFAPLVVLAIFEIMHNQVFRAMRNGTRLIAFYERGLARLENRWMGGGEGGDSFLDPAHPYARDLDIFGKGSLFELLCSARTGIGQHLLAEWLLFPAAPQEIAERQDAVRELRSRIDLREDLAVFGEDLRSQVHPAALKSWADAPAAFKPRRLQLVAPVLAILWILSMLAWAVWGMWPVAVVSSIVNAIFHSRFKARVLHIVPSETFAPDLELLSGVLARLENEKFSTAKISALQSGLKQSGVPPSVAAAKVCRLMQSLESRRNIVLYVLDPFVLWTMQTALAVERWRQEFGPAVPRWLDAVGEMEALCSLASYAYEHPQDVFPEFSNEGPFLDAQGFAHPLLPEAQAVRNDLRMGRELQLVLISGPNMAGKSTLIRALGTNAVLAQCGGPVRASRLRLSPLQVAASICILDSLQGGVSHFYAEITRIKLIVELTKRDLPVLFLFDELLNGTNSHDRRVGAEAVVKSLLRKSAMGLVTTHDLALTQIVSDLEPHAANFHFEDRFEHGELRFDYRLVPGIARSSNALKLMRAIGLEV